MTVKEEIEAMKEMKEKFEEFEKEFRDAVVSFNGNVERAKDYAEEHNKNGITLNMLFEMIR